MIKIVAMWLTAISLLIIACYTVAMYNFQKEYLMMDIPECEETVIYYSA